MLSTYADVALDPSHRWYGMFKFVGNPIVALFIATLVAQLGVPVPGIPLLLAAGVLARDGTLSVPGALVVTVIASGLGHLVWYEAGRRRGTAVLRLLCKISIEPDSCVRKTEDMFVRYGPGALIAAPFVPGLAAVAPPLAGMSSMSIGRFLLLDAAGAALFAAIFLAAGYAAGLQLVSALQVAMRFGGFLALGIGIALGVWLSWKVAQRTRVNPPWLSTSVSRVSPACAPSARPTSCASDAGVQITVDAP